MKLSKKSLQIIVKNVKVTNTDQIDGAHLSLPLHFLASKPDDHMSDSCPTRVKVEKVAISTQGYNWRNTEQEDS